MKIKKIAKMTLKWLLIALACHLLSLVMFGILLSDATYQMAWDTPEDLHAPIVSTLAFDLAMTVLLAIGVEKFWGLSATERAHLRSAGKDPAFSLPRHFFGTEGVSLLCGFAVALVLQLPFLAFFSSYGFSFVETVLLERVYIMDAGFYLFFDSALLGWLLSSLWFILVFAAVRFINLLRTVKED